MIFYNNTKDLKTVILHELGGGNLNVELDDIDIEICISDALFLLSTWSNTRWKDYQFDIVEGQANYDLPTDLLYITSVYFAPMIDTESGAIYNINRRLMRDLFVKVSYSWGANFGVSTLAMYQTYFNERGKIVGSKTEWWRNGSQIVLSPTPKFAQSCVVRYTYVRDVSETTPLELKWVKDYALAKAKYILGLKRRKYGNKTLVGGDTFDLDGDKLVDESKADIERLQEDLENKIAPPPTFLIG